MKRASDTNEVEILDEAFFKHGGNLGWSVFGDGQMTPDEVLAMIEEGEDEEVERVEVFRRMLDLVLEGWDQEQDAEKIGRRTISLAAALGHVRGAGVRMPGARRDLGNGARLEVARRILDFWFSAESTAGGVGRAVLAQGKFVNHPELENWSLRSLGKGCDESAAGVMERVKRLCNKPLESTGGAGKATWQQGRLQREKSAVAQIESHARGRVKK